MEVSNCWKDYGYTYRSCIGYAVSPKRWDDTPYNAECGVISSLSPTLQHGSSTTSVKINERWLHTFASLFEYYLTLYIMKRTFALLLTTAIAVTSCGSLFKYTSYDVSLSSVESPVNAKVKYGETKIASFEEDGQSKYRYEDDFINISWYVGIHKFYFTLKNKSDYSMKIPWDDIVYVDISSNTQRVMHSGVKYTDRNSSQPATIVPKNASISDVLLPTDNVKYVGFYWLGRGISIPSIQKTRRCFS